MHLVAKKVLSIVLIALIIISLGMSFLGYRQGTATTWSEADNDFVTVTYKTNNASVWTFVLAGIQILLILKNRFKLQVIPGILSAANIVLLPLVVKILNLVNDSIVYIKEPTGQSAVRVWELTPVGYAYVTVGWLLLAVSLFAAYWLRRRKAMVDPENDSAQERTEVV